MITVKMVIGLLAFEERAESLLRRGFIIVPWGTICIMFFQPHGIKVFRRNKLCGLSLALVVSSEVENKRRYYTTLITAVFYIWTIT